MQFEWTPNKSMDDLTREGLIYALRYHNGNKTWAAASLKVSIRTIRNWINKRWMLMEFKN